MARLDPHSYADSDQAQTERIDWHARVDFSTQTLISEATLRFKHPASGPFDLDTRDLQIESVHGSQGEALAFELFPPEPILGARLRIELSEGSSSVRIRYRTSPSASALQWLKPAQTAGGQHPFLFTQCQAIHARSVLPLQDTPRLRIRYRAQVTAPANLRTLMAAAFIDRMVVGTEAVETYEMREPIPPYLFAFAVGNLKSEELGPRSRVWAEPEVLKDAAWEFAGVDAILKAAEALLGPYDWERFDLLTMPPSFPYGGMENPRLTFLTPTLLAKDRSLVNVVAHELAHSWTGNLVSNASAEDFWLNEGFTVFAERLLLETLEGKEVAALHAALGRKSLDEALEQFRKQPALTRLKTHLQDVDPDEAYSQVPYEKGYLFLVALDEAVGRPRMLEFLKAYARKFRFQSITTEDFVRFAEEQLPGALVRVNASAWLNAEGLPRTAKAAASTKLDAIRSLHGRAPSDEQAKAWTPAEWQVYLGELQAPAPLALCAELDGRFGLTAKTNYEVLVAWLTQAVRAGYAPAVTRTEEVLGKVGRMKYLRPLYNALDARPETKATALACFERYRAGYHPIAVHVLTGLLKPAAR